jgi:branched-chain amino acid transport system substrate-binding protein
MESGVKHHRGWIAVIAGVAALTAATACSSSGGSGGSSSPAGETTAAAPTESTAGGPTDTGGSSTSSGTPLHIMVSAAISATGTLGANSKMTVHSVKAAVDELNSRGGIEGHQVEVTTVDDQGDPTTAVTKLQDEINSGNKPLAWFNSGPSNLSAAVLPILNQNKILSFNVGPTEDSNDPSKFPLNFDMSPSSANYAIAFCPYAKSQGHTKVAVLYTDDAYGDVLGPAIKASCEKQGSTVTGIQKFDPESLDMTPQIQALKSGNPQAVMLVGYGAEVGYVLKGFTKIGWSVPILGDVAVAATDIINVKPPKGLLGTEEEKTLKFECFKSTVASSNQPANLETMIAALKRQGPVPASLVLAYEYDGVQLLAAGAKAAGTVTDPDAIAKAIVDLKPGDAKTGVFPSYNFTSTDHSPNQPASAFTFATPSELTDGQFDAKT